TQAGGRSGSRTCAGASAPISGKPSKPDAGRAGFGMESVAGSALPVAAQWAAQPMPCAAWCEQSVLFAPVQQERVPESG
ncbi:MAG TPA: hypothetical protein PKC08_08225, partial [Pseudomonadales bacterium]|nr:hypothetical protein [Pseudomonadales bacterium]